VEADLRAPYKSTRVEGIALRLNLHVVIVE